MLYVVGVRFRLSFSAVYGVLACLRPELLQKQGHFVDYCHGCRNLGCLAVHGVLSDTMGYLALTGAIVVGMVVLGQAFQVSFGHM